MQTAQDLRESESTCPHLFQEVSRLPDSCQTTLLLAPFRSPSNGNGEQSVNDGKSLEGDSLLKGPEMQEEILDRFGITRYIEGSDQLRVSGGMKVPWHSCLSQLVKMFSRQWVKMATPFF